MKAHIPIMIMIIVLTNLRDHKRAILLNTDLDAMEKPTNRLWPMEVKKC